MPHLLIIGGSDAGISAALRAREVNPNWEVTILVADHYPNFSICGLPYYLSGEVEDWRTLAHRTRTEIESLGITLALDHVATAIDATAQTVTALTIEGQTRVFHYDTLIIGTGAEPHRPPIDGLDLDGVYVLHTMADSFAVSRHLADRPPRHAVLIGAGYINLEMAEALSSRQIPTTLIQRGPEIHPSVDPAFAQLLQSELERRGVRVQTGTEVRAVHRVGDALAIDSTAMTPLSADMVLVAVGVRPVTHLARQAGCTLGIAGAIQVNRRMETGVPHVYAAGDCVVTHHRLYPDPVYQPLGTTSHKQGRIAGENAVGGDRIFHGVVGTQVVKVGDLVVARTGLLEHEARALGWEPRTVAFETWDHKRYYPEATPLYLRLTGERRTQRLLGGQILGSWGKEISKRIDILATAISQDMQVEQLLDLDLSYTPPLSSPWDPVQMAAQAWQQVHDEV